VLGHPEDRIGGVDELRLLPEGIVDVPAAQHGGAVLGEFPGQEPELVPVHDAVEVQPVLLVPDARDAGRHALGDLVPHIGEVVDEGLVAGQEVDRRDAGDPVPEGSRSGGTRDVDVAPRVPAGDGLDRVAGLVHVRRHVAPAVEQVIVHHDGPAVLDEVEQFALGCVAQVGGQVDPHPVVSRSLPRGRDSLG